MINMFACRLIYILSDYTIKKNEKVILRRTEYFCV